MKRLSNLFKTSFLILLTSSLIAQHLAAQSVYKQARESQITLSGTSTLRDWSMTSTESKCEAAFEIGDDGLPEKLMSLNFIVPFESLKSGNKALDRNAYSTMETEIYKTVTFQLTSATITSTKIQCTGNLSISGTTKPVKLDVEYKISNDNV
ncbi:MAG: YceI family protein, partial [Cyclobacteriaceae bacterium]